jgi:hypothetical protein
MRELYSGGMNDLMIILNSRKDIYDETRYLGKRFMLYHTVRGVGPNQPVRKAAPAIILILFITK